MAYRVPVLEKFAWQEPVLQFIDENTGAELKGDRYLVGAGATGDFAGQAGNVAWYTGDAGRGVNGWEFDTPGDGWRLYNKDDGKFWRYDGASWTDQTAMGNLKLTGDIDSTTAAIDWDLIDNNASALSFDSAGKDGILEIVTTDGAEGVNMSGDLVVAGDLTVQGAVTSVESQNLVVEDPLFTLNKGGTTGSAQLEGVGLEIEADESIVGYLKSSTNLQDWLLKAPSGYELTLDVDVDSKITMLGDLEVQANSAINQDVTTTAIPAFAGLDLNGNLDISTQSTDVNLRGTADALSFDTTSLIGILKIDAAPGSELVSIGKDLYVEGMSEFNGNLTLENAATIDNSISGTLAFNDGSTSVTVAQARKAFDSRAKWDADLEVLVFPDAALDSTAVTP